MSDDYEYYDDSVILSDLWEQLLKVPDHNPLEAWLEAYRNTVSKGVSGLVSYSAESPPDNLFEEYWRIKVPSLLYFGPNDCSVSWKSHDNDRIKRELLDPLDQFICGTKDFEPVYETLTKDPGASGICGAELDDGEPIFFCDECILDDTCVLCEKCFRNSEHVNHNYRMAISNKGGFCDCNDPEAFKKSLGCTLHQTVNKQTLSEDEMINSLPDDIRQRAIMLTAAVVRYTIKVLANETKRIDMAVGKRDIKEFPVLQHVFEDYSNCLTIEKNSIAWLGGLKGVQDHLAFLGLNDKLVQRLVNFMDMEGKAVVYVGSKHKCISLCHKAQRSIASSVAHSWITHENFCAQLLSWLTKLVQRNPAFQAIFSKVFFATETDYKVARTDGTRPCAIVLKEYNIFSEDLRKATFQCLSQSVFKYPLSREKLALDFVKFYGEISKALSTEEDIEYSLSEWSVQLFNVPSIATKILEQDGFHVVLEVLSKIMKDVYGGSSDTMHLDELLDFSTESSYIIGFFSDAQYIINCARSQKLNALMERGFLKGFRTFLDILGLVQKLEPVVHQSKHHVTTETEQFEYIAYFMRYLTQLQRDVVQFIQSHHKKLIKTALRHLHASVSETNYSKTVFHIKAIDYRQDVVDVDVFKNPIAVCAPLARLIADLLAIAKSEDFSQELAEIKPTNHLHPGDPRLFEFAEPSISAIVLFSTAKAGQWVRNGTGFGFLTENYHKHDVLQYSKRRDLLILQILGSEDPDKLVSTLLKRFQLENWCNGSQIGPDEEVANKRALLFAELIAGLLTERFHRVVGKVTYEESIQYRLIQRVSIGSQSHAMLSSDFSHTQIQEVEKGLLTVASLVASSSSTSKKIFTLKPEYEKFFNRFYYFHADEEDRDQAANNITNVIRSRGSVNTVWIPPPSLPKFTTAFKKLYDVMSTKPMLVFVRTVLDKYSKTQKSGQGSQFSELDFKQLHICLFLLAVVAQDFIVNHSSEEGSHLSHGFVELRARLESADLPPDLVPLASHALHKISKVSQLVSGGGGGGETSRIRNIPDSSGPEPEEVLARKRRALECRKKALKEMSNRQNLFKSSHFKELGEIESSQMDTEQSDHGQDADNFVVAVGPLKTHRESRFKDKPLTCIICKETDSDPKNRKEFVLLCDMFMMDFLKQLRRDTNHDPRHLRPNLERGLMVSSCSHLTHKKCFLSAWSDHVGSENFNFEGVYNPCPGCEKPFNAGLRLLLPIDSQPGLSSDDDPSLRLFLNQFIETLSSRTPLTLMSSKRHQLAEVSGDIAVQFNELQVSKHDELINKHEVICKAAATVLHFVQAVTDDKYDTLVVSHKEFFDECLKLSVRACFFAESKSRDLSDVILSNLVEVAANVLGTKIGSFEPTMSFLDFDAIYFLTLLVSGVPHLKPEDWGQQRFGELDRNLVLMATIVHIVQIILGFDLEDTDIDMDFKPQRSNEDEKVLDAFRLVSQTIPLSCQFENFSSPATELKKRMIHFMRCAALFMSFSTNLPVPTSETVNGPDDIYSRLSVYLGLPSTLDQLFDLDGVKCFITRISANSNVSWGERIAHPVKRKRLIDLPESYADLLSEYTKLPCPKRSESRIKTPMVCLVCGKVICAMCQSCGTDTLSTTIKELIDHNTKCCDNSGMFLKVTQAVVLCLGMSRPKSVPAPYRDAFGESDYGLMRGRPMMLDQDEYNQLNEEWKEGRYKGQSLMLQEWENEFILLNDLIDPEDFLE